MCALVVFVYMRWVGVVVVVVFFFLSFSESRRRRRVVVFFFCCSVRERGGMRGADAEGCTTATNAVSQGVRSRGWRCGVGGTTTARPAGQGAGGKKRSNTTQIGGERKRHKEKQNQGMGLRGREGAAAHK
jgi:hypothetical protein